MQTEKGLTLMEETKRKLRKTQESANEGIVKNRQGVANSTRGRQRKKRVEGWRCESQPPLPEKEQSQVLKCPELPERRLLGWEGTLTVSTER